VITGVLVGTFGVAAGTGWGQSLTCYHVGNSLTWDSRPDFGLPRLASDAGLTLTTGWHIRCNGSLNHIVDNPTEVCVSPSAFGYYTESFANYAWDAVTLQPYSSENTPSTPRMEAAGFKSMIQLVRQNPDNADTTFYLYTGWMSQTDMGGDFYSAWYDSTPVDPDADLIRNAAAFDWIYDRLVDDQELAGIDIQVIPVGNVLAELDRRMTLGEIPGFTGVEQLYRDDLHMNNLGWFVASNTVMSALFKLNPTGTPTNPAFILAPGQTESIEITAELGAMIQDAVWDVVWSHPHTCVLPGDLDGDRFVGIGDLNIILSDWNQHVCPANIQADPTCDGFIGIADLNIVCGNWNNGIPPGSVVPEPAISLLMLVTLVTACPHRGRRSHWGSTCGAIRVR
jgi:hypothetical protein